jgi:hypothetical protein
MKEPPHRKRSDALSIYRTTAPITSANLDTSPLHKELALSCHCLPLSAGGECLRERSVVGASRSTSSTVPLDNNNATSHAVESYRPRFYLARLIWAQSRSSDYVRAYKAATGTRSTDGFAGLSAINATPITTSTADPTKNPTF